MVMPRIILIFVSKVMITENAMKEELSFFLGIDQHTSDLLQNTLLLKFLEDHSNKWSNCNITLGPMTEDRLLIFLWQWSPHFQLQ